MSDRIRAALRRACHRVSRDTVIVWCAAITAVWIFGLATLAAAMLK